MYDVITMGSATVDILSFVSKKFNQINMGDKVLIEDIDFETGGGGINSAVALSRMGMKTAFLGKLGKDHNADKILSEMKKEKVTVIKTKSSDDATSYSFLLHCKGQKDRVIFTYKGASDHLKPREVDLKKLSTKWIYMATLLQESFKTAEKVAKHAKKKGIKLLFNPSSYLAAKGKKYLNTILQSTTILVLNRRESELLLGRKEKHIEKLAKSLFRLGPELVVITEGEKGLHAYNGDCLFHMKPYQVKIVSTAGAGDAFTSGFLAGMIKHDSIETAFELGMANATSVIQYHGTKNRLLSYKEAKKIISKHKNIIHKRKC